MRCTGALYYLQGMMQKKSQLGSLTLLYETECIARKVEGS